MAEPALKVEPRYTYADYLQWNGDERYELIDGAAYCMSPAPTRTHQHVVLDLGRQIADFLEGKKCEVFVAPFDVRLPDNSPDDADVRNVVQPDVVVICDPKKIEERGCLGAPDFIIEVASPSNTARDLALKCALYERHGVREYWVVQPDERVVVKYVMGPGGRWVPPEFVEGKGRLAVTVLPGLEINLDRLFPPLPPRPTGPARERRI